MAGLGDFIAGVGAEYNKQDAMRREEQMYARKLKMANDMAIQLEERKRALAQQYPTYNYFTKVSNGDIVGVDTMGRPQRVLEADPETKKQVAESAAAKSAEDRARAAYYGAQASLLGAKEREPQKYMQPTRPKGETPYRRPPNEFTAADYDTAYLRFRQGRGKVDFAGKVTPAPDSPEMRQAFDEYMRAMKLQAPSAGKPQGLLNMAAPQSSGSGDEEALMNLLFPQGG